MDDIYNSKIEAVQQKADKNVFLGIYPTLWHTLRHKICVWYVRSCSLPSEMVWQSECSGRILSRASAAAAAAAAGSCRSERLVQHQPSFSSYTPHETTSRCWAGVRSPASCTKHYTHLLFGWDWRGSSSWSLKKQINISSYKNQTETPVYKFYFILKWIKTNSDTLQI